MKNFFFLFLAGISFLVSVSSCKKDSFITSPDARLRIDADTIKFDTIFTTAGSVTQSFKIVNENNQKLKLSSVKLMGGSASSFKININGVAASELTNVEIAADDSIYIFVSVLVNPSTSNLPFIISDSIAVQYNDNQRWVQLQAYGQNAHFLNNQTITANTTWPNDLPYVVLGSLLVAENVALSIDSGVKVFIHADAPLVIDGSLIVNGSVNNHVIFTGDRLDEPYKNYPASWPGIFFRRTSTNNLLRFAEIKNAYQALVVLEPSANTNPKLLIEQTIIDNAYSAGILASNTSILASNLLISNCANNINIQLGGTYSFTHCTAASYSNNFMLHRTPVLAVANFATQSGSTATNALQASFTNCIFWGDNGFVDDEILVSKQGTTAFSVSLVNCLYKAMNDPANTTLSSSIKNIEPLFDSVDVIKNYYDFKQNNNPLAPGLNKGMATLINADLDGNARPIGLPDIGCYEKQ